MRIMKTRREIREWESLLSYLDVEGEEIGLDSDPALTDASLAQKLARNDRVGKKRMSSVSCCPDLFNVYSTYCEIVGVGNCNVI